MAEILTKKYNYKIDVYTSNAIDFKALRNSEGKTITKENKSLNKDHLPVFIFNKFFFLFHIVLFKDYLSSMSQIL